MGELALKVDKVSKHFKLPVEGGSSLKQTVLNLHRRRYQKLTVLKDIDFEVKRGEFFGIVGRNGSGKSTLLKIIAGIYQPTSGGVDIRGKLTPFIELGVGFNPELSGRDNIYLNGAILGLTKKQIEAKYHDIVAFAELEKFMDQKLKNYSSGMQVRLAFSIAIQAQSDILLIDEVLAVGDANFQRKCFDFFKTIKSSGKTVVFVSHDMTAVQEYCDRAMLIHDGRVKIIGKSGQVAQLYNRQNLAEAEKEINSATKKQPLSRWGNQAATIHNIWTERSGKKSATFEPGNNIEIVLNIKARQAIEHPVVGVVIKSLDGLPIFATNTSVERVATPKLSKGQMLEVRFLLPNHFNDGSYTVAPAIANATGKVFYDWIEDAAKFRVGGWPMAYGLVQASHKITTKILKT